LSRCHTAELGLGKKRLAEGRRKRLNAEVGRKAIDSGLVRTLDIPSADELLRTVKQLLSSHDALSAETAALGPRVAEEEKQVAAEFGIQRDGQGMLDFQTVCQVHQKKLAQAMSARASASLDIGRTVLEKGYYRDLGPEAQAIAEAFSEGPAAASPVGAPRSPPTAIGSTPSPGGSTPDAARDRKDAPANAQMGDDAAQPEHEIELRQTDDEMPSKRPISRRLLRILAPWKDVPGWHLLKIFLWYLGTLASAGGLALFWLGAEEAPPKCYGCGGEPTRTVTVEYTSVGFGEVERRSVPILLCEECEPPMRLVKSDAKEDRVLAGRQRSETTTPRATFFEIVFWTCLVACVVCLFVSIHITLIVYRGYGF